MLSINGTNRFYYLCDFHDMHCKYERVLSIIHQQLDQESKEGDVFIVLSKELRNVRLFSYDRRSYSLYEKRFTPGYQFMRIVNDATCRSGRQLRNLDLILIPICPRTKSPN